MASNLDKLERNLMRVARAASDVLSMMFFIGALRITGEIESGCQRTPTNETPP